MNSFQPQTDRDTLPAVYSRPAALFFLAVGIIFLAEFLVMLLLSRMTGIDPLAEALIDAFLLSSLIIPALYFFVYRSLKMNIGNRLRAETSQQKMHEINQLKSQFISTAAHELATPLSAVIGYTELLLSPLELTEEDRDQHLQTVLSKANVLDRLIDDLLDLSRIDSGQMSHFEKKNQLLLPIVESVVHYFRDSMPEQIIKTVVADESLRLSFDAVRIGQVLENLIGNAIKYSPDKAPVRLSVEDLDKGVSITVSDQGIGIAPEHCSQIFGKFFRVDCSDTSIGGLGLGLTIVKEIVEGHAGTVHVESSLGQGTSVQVLLPHS